MTRSKRLRKMKGQSSKRTTEASLRIRGKKGKSAIGTCGDKRAGLPCTVSCDTDDEDILCGSPSTSKDSWAGQLTSDGKKRKGRYIFEDSDVELMGSISGNIDIDEDASVLSLETLSEDLNEKSVNSSDVGSGDNTEGNESSINSSDVGSGDNTESNESGGAPAVEKDEEDSYEWMDYTFDIDGCSVEDLRKKFGPRTAPIVAPTDVDIAALKQTPYFVVEIMTPEFLAMEGVGNPKYEGGLHPNRIPYIGAVFVVATSFIHNYSTVRLDCNNHYGIHVEDIGSYLEYAARANVTVYLAPMEQSHVIFTKKMLNSLLPDGSAKFPSRLEDDILFEAFNPRSNLGKIMDNVATLIEGLCWQKLMSFAMSDEQISERNNYQKSLGYLQRHQPRNPETAQAGPGLSREAIDEFSDAFVSNTDLLKCSHYKFPDETSPNHASYQQRLSYPKRIHVHNVIGALTAIVSVFKIALQTIGQWRVWTSDNGIDTDGVYDRIKARMNWSKLVESHMDGLNPNTKIKLKSTVPLMVVADGIVDTEVVTDLGIVCRKNKRCTSNNESVTFEDVQALFTHGDKGNSTEEGSDYCNAAKQFAYLYQICDDVDNGVRRYMKTGYCLLTTTAYDKHAITTSMKKSEWMEELVEEAVDGAERYPEKQLDLMQIFSNTVGVPVPMLIDKCSLYSGMVSVILEYNEKFPLCFEQVVEFAITITAVNSPSRWAEVIRDWVREGHVLKRHVLLEYMDWNRVRYGSVSGGICPRFGATFNFDMKELIVYQETRKIADLTKQMKEAISRKGTGAESQKIREAYDNLLDGIHRCKIRTSELTAQHVIGVCTMLGIIKEPLCLYFARIPLETHSGQRIIAKIAKKVGCSTIAKSLFLKERTNILRMVVAAMKARYPDIEITELWAENLLCKNDLYISRNEIIDGSMRVIYVEVERDNRGYVIAARLMTFTKDEPVPVEWQPPVFPLYSEMDKNIKLQRECLWENRHLCLEEKIDPNKVVVNAMVEAEFRKLIKSGKNDGYALAKQCWSNMAKERKVKILDTLSTTNTALVLQWDAENRRKRKTRTALGQSEEEEMISEEDPTLKLHLEALKTSKSGKKKFQKLSVEESRQKIEQLMNRGTSKTTRSDTQIETAIARYGVYPTPWSATPAVYNQRKKTPSSSSRKQRSRPPPVNTESMLAKKVAAQVRKLKRMGIPKTMPSPFQMLDEIMKLYQEVEETRPSKSRRLLHSDFVEKTNTSTPQRSGRKNVNAFRLFEKFNPPQGVSVSGSLTVYRALACCSDGSDSVYNVDDSNILAWEHPQLDKTPERVGTKRSLHGYYATITINGKEYDYSFNSLLDNILPGQLSERSSKGRYLYVEPGIAKAAVCFLRALDQPISNFDYLSLLEAKSKRLSQEPRMMKYLIKKYGRWCRWPRKSAAESESESDARANYVFLNFSGFHLPGTGDSKSTGVKIDDPHVALLRHGFNYYIGGFKGGCGITTETGELNPVLPNNMIWRNMSALDRYCRIWNADTPKIGHGHIVQQQGHKYNNSKRRRYRHHGSSKPH